jgi:hypothetical protein
MASITSWRQVGMLGGVGLAGDPIIDEGQDIGGVDHLQGALDAALLDIGVIVDLRGFWGVTA